MSAVKKKQRVIAVCGVKNSGKTTLLERIIRELYQRGFLVAVIKHDGHDFACDIPGTDSFRLGEAGAYGTAVYSKERMFVQKKGTLETERELLQLFPEADVIFLEGQKDSSYPKIEVVRNAVSKELVSNPEGRFLIVTDGTGFAGKEMAEDCATAGFEELDVIIERILAVLPVEPRCQEKKG